LRARFRSRMLRAALPALVAAVALPGLARRPDGLADDAVARALALATEAATATAPRSARVEAVAGTLDPRLKLAACPHVEAFLPAGVPAWGRTQVALRCTDGPVRWRVFLPVDVHVWAKGVVAKTALPSGVRLTASEVEVAQVDWAAGGGAFDDPARLEGRTLIRPLAPGEALRPSELQPQLWFDIGETVRVEVGGDGFVVSADGQALARGIDGQLVRVRTRSGRVVVGRAVSDHCVEVSL
jgi:flagellar basal body P-ring formation protein FlgA